MIRLGRLRRCSFDRGCRLQRRICWCRCRRRGGMERGLRTTRPSCSRVGSLCNRIRCAGVARRPRCSSGARIESWPNTVSLLCSYAIVASRGSISRSIQRHFAGFRRTVACIEYVCVMCVTTKSSKRLLAPGATDAGVRLGLECRHLIASI